MVNLNRKLGLAIVCSLTLYGCSSSGGDTATGAVTYSGLTTPATITAANADGLASTAVNGSAAGATVAAGAINKNSINTFGLAQTVLSQSDLVTADAASMPAAGAIQTISQTLNGADYGGSGSATVVGSIDNVTGYGSLTVTYNHFSDGYSNTTFNGVMTLTNDATGKTISFSNITITDASGVFSMGGSVHSKITATGEILTMNIVASSSAGLAVKVENFVVITTTNALGQVVDESGSGRIYNSAEGYIDITTTSPLVYSPAGSIYPSSGGPVIATGSGGTIVKVTPVDAMSVLIEADTTGDGNFDYSKTTLWSTL